jgi:Xaa-Pro aminopeptidase
MNYSLAQAPPEAVLAPVVVPVSVYAQRRRALAEQLRLRGGGIAILLTAPEVARNRDSHYPYRWDSYFYYLTGFQEPESALVLRVSGTDTESILFCRDKNEEREIWDGFRFGPAAAREQFGLDASHSITALDEQMGKLLADQPSVFYALGSEPILDAQMQRWLAAVRAQARAGVSAPAQAFDVRVLVDEMRLIKDKHEIAVMRRAGQIAAHAHIRAMKASRPGKYEYEVEAELLHEFRRYGSQAPAYGSIVAGGRNGCVLHYRENNAALKENELLLIDAGCELDGYASDITRTFPVNGRFTAGQRALYDIVLAAQAAAIGETKPGKRFIDPHDAAVRVLTQGMIDCKLISGSLDGAIESGSFRRFYMHRTSHWLGMDVHDCGEYREPGEAATKDGKPWRKLKPGMVLTIEPGIYVPAADDVPRAFHNVGIRIEDDALVTKKGCELLTTQVPSKADDIEALMRER